RHVSVVSPKEESMRRLSLSFALAALVVVVAPAALADGPPPFVIQGGTGVAAPGHGGIHYVAVSVQGRPYAALPPQTGGTLLEAVNASDGISWWASVKGAWGIPTIGSSDGVGYGLSRDGRTLVLESTAGPYASPSKFLLMDPTRMKVLRT